MATRQRASPKAWHQHLTLDLLIKVGRKTVFHPFVMWMVPLSLRAQLTPTHDLSYRLTTAYAIFLTALTILLFINKRIAYGTPRTVNVSEEIVLVTGGASGLGRLIADFYAMRGAAVAVLDVKMIEDDSNKITSYKCDIGDARQIVDTLAKVRKELGTPTVVINNAAILYGKPLLDLSAEDIETGFKVNLLSHFHMIRELLPGMLEEGRGTIVTVASVLGYIGVANLSDYTASKAGLIAMHRSLLAELRYSSHPSAKSIQTVLVTPGQLGTPMFSDMITPSNFIAPVLDPIDLAKAIVEKIDSGESGEISLPYYAQWIQWMNILPSGIQRVARWVAGVDQAMFDFSRKRAA